MLTGIGWNDRTIAGSVSAEAFERGLIIETSGSTSSVLKLLPPLTISDSELEAGLAIIETAIATVLGARAPACASIRQTADNAAM